MKRKKQKQSLTAAVTTADVGDLEALIQLHAGFVDHLIELIPAKFYLPNDDVGSKKWYKGLSKTAKNSRKRQTKENRKIVRRHRFDPERQQQIAKTTLPDEVPNKGNSVNPEAEKSVTLEELREKLHRKIESLRGNRGEKKFDNEYNRQGYKRKHSGDGDDGAEESGEEIIEYGNVRLGDDEEGSKKKPKLSKTKELELAKRLQEAKKEKPFVAEKEAWKAAASRAMGVKVHDDARLIKESIKRDKKKKEKNAEKWKERVESQNKVKVERQKKRQENIGGRIKEKKMKKIAKREKKLMRPGFEGRKAGFITKE